MSAIEYNMAHKRSLKLVFWLFRERWRYATLHALHDGHQRPAEILEVFQAAAAADTKYFGAQAVYRECVALHLSLLHNAGMIRRVKGSTAESGFELTDLTRGALEAVEPVADFALGVYPALAALAYPRARHRPIRLDATPRSSQWAVPDGDPAARRRAAAILLGPVLSPRWTISTLMELGRAPLRAGQLADMVRLFFEANQDAMIRQPPSRTSVANRVGYLRGLGLARVEPDPAGRNPARPPGSAENGTTLTSLGSALLDALSPLAEYGVLHSAGFTAMARTMRTDAPGAARTDTALPDGRP